MWSGNARASMTKIPLELRHACRTAGWTGEVSTGGWPPDAPEAKDAVQCPQPDEVERPRQEHTALAICQLPPAAAWIGTERINAGVDAVWAAVPRPRARLQGQVGSSPVTPMITFITHTPVSPAQVSCACTCMCADQPRIGSAPQQLTLAQWQPDLEQPNRQALRAPQAAERQPSRQRDCGSSVTPVSL